MRRVAGGDYLGVRPEDGALTAARREPQERIECGGGLDDVVGGVDDRGQGQLRADQVEEGGGLPGGRLDGLAPE
jgi:hypothetical protein